MIVWVASRTLYHSHSHNSLTRGADKCRVMHRDIKPANLLLDARGNLKLVDFGAAKAGANHRQPTSHEECGTRAYMAPEVVHAQSALRSRTISPRLACVHRACVWWRPQYADHDGTMCRALLPLEPALACTQYSCMFPWNPLLAGALSSANGATSNTSMHPKDV